MHCPACGAEIPDDDLFCEACGHSLKAAAAPPACGCGAATGEVDEDGYCGRCGRRVMRPAEDHVEETLSPLCAGVSDRGLRHDRNEDRFSIVQVGEAYALVVCDGVSTTRKSEVASQAVATGVMEHLAAALRTGAVVDPVLTMRSAIAAGGSALAAVSPADGSENPPSTTVVAALVIHGEATIGWAGDSRAYWLKPPAIQALTKDHSWVHEMVALGKMSEAEAEKAPQAHAITRWIGVDAETTEEAELVLQPLQGPGMLLLCTDGLWNYAAAPEEMAKLVADCSHDNPAALTLAQRLAEFANAHGGHDNITVALLRLEPAASPNV